ncbi:hypothetical protein KEBGJNKE_00011 [Enterococcus phage vB_OCPT_Bop]|uniref:Uncharacterized protein n=4 Tax=Schiekvirus TaxID=2732968 RepID=A0A8D6UEX9_9CAUD|nr:hypothetical protein KEBGJNKE_00011 [Enterococcus phage vB_OCPT_Bop]CAI9421080.1 Hypothetical protein PORT_1 [Enterococcus phage Porthos]CAI9421267.1 Hypothetical protein PORT_188 [Enterococcus phage Porthos]
MTNTTNKPKYLVVDNYDLDMYELGRVNTMREVKKLCKEQVEATDGECYVMVLTLNEETNKYSRKSAEIVHY